jgi:NAD-specific glutamate dehydrogenase
MMSNPDAKREHLARAAEAAAQFSVREAAGSGWGESPEVFLAAYYRHVAAEDILTRNPSQLSGLAFLHQRLAMERSTGSALVRVYTPSTSEADGWPTARSLVQIVTDDMPFLVTSVTAELTRQRSTVRARARRQSGSLAVSGRSWRMSGLLSTMGQRCASRRCRRPLTCRLIRQREWNRLMSRRR